MVVEGEGRKVGLFVDDLLGQQQVVIKSLETNFRRVDGVSGATILGDGAVALILDVPGLIRVRDAEAGCVAAARASRLVRRLDSTGIDRQRLAARDCLGSQEQVGAQKRAKESIVMNTWNISVKAKLFATLALTGIVMILVGVIGLSGTKSSNSDLDAIFSNRFMPTRLGRHHRNARARGAREGRGSGHPSGCRRGQGRARSAPGAPGRSERAAEEARRHRAHRLRSARSSNSSAATAATCWAWCRKRCSPRSPATSALRKARLIEKARPAYEKLNTAGDNLLKTQIEVAQEMRTEADASFKKTSAFIIGAIVVGIGLSRSARPADHPLHRQHVEHGGEHRRPHRQRRTGQRRA